MYTSETFSVRLLVDSTLQNVIVPVFARNQLGGKCGRRIYFCEFGIDVEEHYYSYLLFFII
jgi:hypothetical protein